MVWNGKKSKIVFSHGRGGPDCWGPGSGVARRCRLATRTEAFAISGRRRGSLLPQDLMVFSWLGYVPELGLRLQDDFRLHSETALDC